MISDEMIKKLTIGTIIQSNTPKRKWGYLSHEDRNGKSNQSLYVGELGETINWFFAGIKIVGKRKLLRCIEKNPIISLGFRGGTGCFYGERELNNIARYWFGKKFCYPKSISISDVNLLLGVEIKPPNNQYTLGKGEYSPESFVKHRLAREGTKIRQIAYSYNVNELPSSPANEIIFINKSYWLASRSISIQDNCAYYGLGEVTKEGCVNMGHNLFKSNGENVEGLNTSLIRFVVYIDPNMYDLIELDTGAYQLIES